MSNPPPDPPLRSLCSRGARAPPLVTITLALDTASCSPEGSRGFPRDIPWPSVTVPTRLAPWPSLEHVGAGLGAEPGPSLATLPWPWHGGPVVRGSRGSAICVENLLRRRLLDLGFLGRCLLGRHGNDRLQNGRGQAMTSLGPVDLAMAHA